MKILIVAAYFPPQNSIASLRPYSWAKWWSRAGHEVTVLTTVKVDQKNNLALDCSGFNIISVPVPSFSRFSSEYHGVIMENKNNLKEKITSIIKKYYSSFAKKTGCFYTCRFPDFHDLWAKTAIKKIRGLTFNIVISTGWPYSVHRVALSLKKKYHETKWIVDWRDLWTHNHIYKGLRIFLFYEKYLENKFHDNADLITTVSYPLAKILSNTTKTNVEVIYNGYDQDDYDEIKKRVRNQLQPLTIVYTGSIYRGFQDPSPLFEAISNLKKNNIIKKNDLKILFAGANADVGDIANYYDVLDFYSFLGFLPREDVLQLQYDSDLVLYLDWNDPASPWVLAGKLFEYLYIAREIMVIGKNKETTANEIISSTQTGLCLGNNCKEIETFLVNRLYNRVQSNSNKRHQPLIDEFNRKNQAMKILELVKDK